MHHAHSTDVLARRVDLARLALSCAPRSPRSPTRHRHASHAHHAWCCYSCFPTAEVYFVVSGHLLACHPAIPGMPYPIDKHEQEDTWHDQAMPHKAKQIGRLCWEVKANGIGPETGLTLPAEHASGFLSFPKSVALGRHQVTVNPQTKNPQTKNIF